MFGNFLQKMRLLENEECYLKEIRGKCKTAKDLGKTECVKCGYCCQKRSCIPTPDELIKIAAFLHLSVLDCIHQYYVIDTQDYKIFYVKPVGVNRIEYVGSLEPSSKTYGEGKCIFLDINNLCVIHAVKPHNAQVMKCWEEKNEEFDPKDSWKDNQLQKIYPEFTGELTGEDDE